MHRIESGIWQEEAGDNPFVAEVARCRGYDVFGDMLPRAGWADMVFLLFAGEAPTATQRGVLNGLAVVLANSGPRAPAVHAAMCGGAGRAPAAASLMAALAVGAGRVGGAREVFLAVDAWREAKKDAMKMFAALAKTEQDAADIWPADDTWPGFDPHSRDCALPVRQALAHFATIVSNGALASLSIHREGLEHQAMRGLAMTGVAAAAYIDLGLDADQAEMLHLLLCLPGAAAHALEMRSKSYKALPFGDIELLQEGALKHKDPAEYFSPSPGALP